jgi:hypothetical protein
LYNKVIHQSFKPNQEMSSVVKSLFIGAIDTSFTADHIMDAFYCQDIATISRVTLVPFNTKSGPLNRAYLDIHEWHTTEVAYNFIQRLKDSNKEARIIHTDDNWWAVRVNKNPFITDSKKMAKFTTSNHLIAPMSEPECLPWILYGQHAQEETEWKDLEKDLSEMLAYQNLEYELCL